MTAEASKYLFVYGTLRSNSAHPMAEFLRKNASLLGHATMPGRLYRLGDYPGAVYDENAETLICGEVYEIENAPVLFAQLDAYEGVEDLPQQPAEYQRALAKVSFNGSSIYCWTYLCKQENKALPQVPPNNHKLLCWYGICPSQC